MRNHFSLEEKGFRASKKNLFCAYPSFKRRRHGAARIEERSIPLRATRRSPWEEFGSLRSDFGAPSLYRVVNRAPFRPNTKAPASEAGALFYGAVDAGIGSLYGGRGVLARRFDDNLRKIQRRSVAGWRGRG